MNKLAEDIGRYGVRVDTVELDIVITQYLYIYEDRKYLITMKKGEVVNIYEVL